MAMDAYVFHLSRSHLEILIVRVLHVVCSVLGT